MEKGKVKQKERYKRVVERAMKQFSHTEMNDFVERGGCFKVKRYFHLLGFKNIESVRNNFLTGKKVVN